MPVLKHKRTQNFTVVPNELIRDKSLSLKSMGLLCFLLHLPDDWNFSVAGLEKFLSRDGRESINRSLREISEAGYLIREQGRDKNGRLTVNNWIVSDEPIFKNAAFPPAEKPFTESATQLRTNIQKKNSPKNKEVQIEIVDGKEVAIID